MVPLPGRVMVPNARRKFCRPRPMTATPANPPVSSSRRRLTVIPHSPVKGLRIGGLMRTSFERVSRWWMK